MFIKPDENGKYPTRYLPTRLMLAIRILVGLYLFYLVYQLRGSIIPPIAKENIVIAIAAYVFVIVAIIIIFFSVKDLMSGKFQGGELDAEVLEDDAVKHIDGLDKPKDTTNDSIMAKANSVPHVEDNEQDSAPDDDPYDPHNVVFKKKKSQE